MTGPVTRQATAENRKKEKQEKQRKTQRSKKRKDEEEEGELEDTQAEKLEVMPEIRSSGRKRGERGRQKASSLVPKDSEQTLTEPPGKSERGTKTQLPSSGKRRRPPSISPSPERDDKRRRKEVYRGREAIRPGVPAPVNPRSFVRTDRPSGPDRGDNDEGHFQYALGENITSRYKILSKMGEGTFGRVLECWDRKNKTYVALKIVRSLPKYRDAAMQELEVLNTLIVNDREGRYQWVRLLEWFDYRKHVCIVFEKLGLSLYDFLRINSYIAFHIDLVRQFGRQLLRSVAYLHDLNLIHTDLKPENIMLQSAEYDKFVAPGGRSSKRMTIRVPKSPAIKLIDFGSAIFEDQHHSSIVSTRHYRAPEVILGLGWSFPVDIWSIGCILIELATGSALFQTHDNMEHLAMMQQVLGPIPESLATLAIQQVNSEFFKRNRLAWPSMAKDKKSVRAVKKMNTLRSILLDEGHPSTRDWLDDLVDLVKKMMRYEPSARIRASQALEHPFFRIGESESSGQRNRSVENWGGPKEGEVIVLED